MTFFILIGIFSGLLAGLLGIGGGIIVIPCLVAIFSYQQLFPSYVIMHIAIGTSLAGVIVTAAAASISHYKRQGIRWDFVKTLLPGLISGAIVGAYIAQFLSSDFLRKFFGIFLIFIALRLFFIKQDEQTRAWQSHKILLIAAFIMGALSSILGIGGGVLLVPVLIHYGINTRQLAGTSATCGCAIATTATICFVLSDFFATRHFSGATGYVYWPAFFGIALGSMVSAPLGARLAHALPTSLLKRLFAVLLLLIAIHMLFFGK